MVRWLRTLTWMAILTGAAVAGYAVLQRRRGEQLAAPEWPPFDTAPPAAAGGNGATDRAAAGATDRIAAGATAGAADSATWAVAVDGTCPDGFPVKANEKSRIYHLPGGRFYDRTRPDRCYTSADAAEADGYRAAKS